MKHLKLADKAFKLIGFTKTYENKFLIRYERETIYYTQVIDINCKAKGLHLIKSYEKDKLIEGHSIIVGMTGYQMELCLRKMKEIGWKFGKY
jgi:hypothetical protein